MAWQQPAGAAQCVRTVVDVGGLERPARRGPWRCGAWHRILRARPVRIVESMSLPSISLQPEPPEFLVACLCAAWCGTCRDYQAGFEAMAARFPGARFMWVDVEDDAELVDDYDVENFPTVLIQRHDSVLFFGAMLPHHELLQRTLESFQAQSPDESRRYALSDPERRRWQDDYNLARALAGRQQE